jgi:uncharacterized protein YecT (DUF1311 family)
MRLKWWYLFALLIVVAGCAPAANRDASNSSESLVSVKQSDGSGDLSVPDSEHLITSTQIGPARIGMTIGELKRQIGDRAEFVNEPSFMVDLNAIAVRQNGEVLFYILQFESESMEDSDPIQLLLTTHPDYRTEAGVGPGVSIEKAASVYGEPMLSYNSQNEMRESVRFANFSASNVVFRTNGFDADYTLAGSYGEPVDDTFYETKTYRSGASIQAVMVDGNRLEVGNRPAVDENNVDCNNPRGTAAINACAEQDYEQADAELNRVYQEAIASLDANSEEMLIDAQLAWIKFRDESCEYVTQRLSDGAGQSAYMNRCLAVMTRDRTEDLELPQADSLLNVSASDWGDLGTVTVDGQQIDCNNPQVTPEINYCAGLAYQKIDQQLNQVYQSVIGELGESTAEQLIDAQLAWIDFRDTHCEFEVRDAVGGTGYSSYLSGCMARLTRDRVEALQTVDSRMLPF